ncbi:hypothetical protein [Caenimonas soli]|uniref:hypothetical protein n=1 Tax=Caenimonas soli TaxID=2735555 RepID=UPI00155254EC|nr:hypothetical protein [Caenimonas soli]NPC58514.1 hypothetical protein [Caenimonas soli]
MSSSSNTYPAALDDEQLLAIFRALKRGRGRELVTDANVDALIGLARFYRQEQLEYLLREWRSACGEDAEAMNFEQFSRQPPAA